MDVEEEEGNEADKSFFYDLDMNNLEHAFDLSQGSTDDGMYNGYREDRSEAGKAVDWDDIDALTKHETKSPEDEDSDAQYEDIDENWSPLGYEEQHKGAIYEGVGWLDVQDEQLEAAPSAFQSSQRDDVWYCYEEDGYMDADEMDLFAMGMEDEYEADEGISLWLNEHEMVEHIS